MRKRIFKLKCIVIVLHYGNPFVHFVLLEVEHGPA